ncbi:hypothetical protein SAMN05661080_04278 [Modestobacter sp. DSM 44400]|uniref:hypothetical protein n=1 Tax=Modestobacter sp. DSM 44400 TaxID=1550230 RepID=UPI000894DC60|nr:hypothetical protein [Modestobacter sp. DSM 44400]SDY68522.1 hypothetical protein SAMN05661080_04278 [Modestobacter sp. DSM 44400]
MREWSSAAWEVFPAPLVVSSTTCVTPVIVRAIPADPVAASATLRAISLVVAVCSSTAEAIVVCSAMDVITLTSGMAAAH